MVKKRKLNIIDILVILIIVLAIAVVATKLLGSKVQDAVSPKVDCWVEVDVVGTPPRIFEEAMRQDLVGQQLVSGNEYLSATVEDVWLEDYIMQAIRDDGIIVDAVDPSKKDMIVLIHTMVAADTPSPKIGSQELRAGRTYIVKTQTFEMSGTIRYVEMGDYNSPYEH